MKLEYSILSVPYITRDLVDRKLKERRSKETSMFNKFRLTAYLLFIPLINYTGEPLIRHLNKRGIHTCYWVVNHDDELLDLAKTSEV